MRRYSFPPLSLALLLALCSPGAAQSNRLTPTSEPRVRGASPAAAAPRPAIRTGFSCSPKNLEVREAGNDHFRIRFPKGGRDKVGWFLFQVKNAAGRTLRIDLTNIPFEKWKTLHPLVHESENLHALENYRTPPIDLRRRGTPPSRAPRSPRPRRPRRPGSARSGGRAPASSPIPDDSAQRWKFIRSVTPNEETKALTLRHTFRTNSAYVAMRYPYTPEYHERYIRTLWYNPRLKLHTVGESEAGRPLYVVQIGGLDENEAKRKPCIVLYAREHADEQDTSWLAQGAVDYLISDQPGARALRRRATYLIIPLLDPDGAAQSRYEHITHQFHPNQNMPTSRGFGRFFHRWVQAGKRLDLVLNLHNTESSGRDHLECAQIETGRVRRPASRALHRMVRTTLEKRGYRVAEESWGTGVSQLRLGGWLAETYGPLHVAYEANAQEENRHLTLLELKSMGASLLQAAAGFFSSGQTGALVRQINQRRAYREKLVKRYGALKNAGLDPETPFYFENSLLARPDFERWYRTHRETKPWIQALRSAPYPTLWQQGRNP